MKGSNRFQKAIKRPIGCCGNLCGGLRDFILRGNVVDLAVAVVLGTAFESLINSFVSSFITPLIGIIGNPSKTETLTFTINGSTFRYGVFINQFISFVIVLLVVYFLVIIPLMKFLEYVLPSRTCPKCLSFDVPAAATVCKVCGSDIPQVIPLIKDHNERVVGVEGGEGRGRDVGLAEDTTLRSHHRDDHSEGAPRDNEVEEFRDLEAQTSTHTTILHP